MLNIHAVRPSSPFLENQVETCPTLEKRGREGGRIREIVRGGGGQFRARASEHKTHLNQRDHTTSGHTKQPETPVATPGDPNPGEPHRQRPHQTAQGQPLHQPPQADQDPEDPTPAGPDPPLPAATTETGPTAPKTATKTTGTGPAGPTSPVATPAPTSRPPRKCGIARSTILHLEASERGEMV